MGNCKSNESLNSSRGVVQFKDECSASKQSEHENSPLALFEAVSCNDWEKSRQLLLSNDAERLVRQIIDQHGFRRTVLHEACRRMAPLDIVKSIVGTYPEITKSTGPLKGAPLGNACRWASEEVTLFLLDTAPEDVNFINMSSRNCLHIAINNRRSPLIIRKILQINIDLINNVDLWGIKPIHLFFWRWEESLQECLDDLESLPQGEDTDGLSVLRDTLILLINATIDGKINDETSDDKYFVIHKAFHLDYIPNVFIEFLIKIMPAEARKPDPDGNLILHLALTRTAKTMPVFQTLNLSEIEDNFSHEMFESKKNAKKCNDSHLIKAILAIYPEAIKISNQEGNLPLILAARSGVSLEIIRMIYEAYPIAISNVDIKTGLNAFALAAVTESSQTQERHLHRINISLELLLAMPDILE